jgi:hypothetical protein
MLCITRKMKESKSAANIGILSSGRCGCTHAAEKELFDPEQEADKEGRKCPLYRFQKI